MAQITLRDYLQGTEDAIRDGRIDDAFDYCRNILAQYPESLEAQRLLGEAYLAQGHLEEALQSFDWILTNDPENVVVYCDRALISESSSDYDTALDCYQQAYELSHGNSQIRQEFNRLSAKSGQQGFMFSRAGLARLYMRGDLLTQAVQEWETVLALSPERLDARTGLLETCWREAQYDRVEQLAIQILQDVPGCLKAILLLAYVSSTKNIQKTQELLKQASALDPDLLLAQEIFSDLMASQPVDPFLLLLKRAPALIEMALDQPVVNSSTDLKQIQAQPSPIPVTSPALEPLVPAWSEPVWADQLRDSDRSLVQSTPERLQESSPQPMWSAEADQTYDAWNMSDGPQEARSLQELRDFSAQLKNSQRSENSLEQSQPIESLSLSPQQEQHSPEPKLSGPSSVTGTPKNASQEADLAPFWDNSSSYDSTKEPDSSSLDIWGNTPGSISESGTWISPTQDGSQPTPPAWLNMLTQSERRQLNDEAPTASTQEPVAASSPAPQPVQKEKLESRPVQKEKPEPIFVPGDEPDDDQESFSFGPEWLKSLGATAIEEDSPAIAAPLLASTPQETPEVEEKQPTYELQPVASQAAEDELQLAPFGEENASSAGTAEYNLLTTLEGLEAGLLSQGFVPMEPNSLLAIAKNQEGPSSAVPYTPDPIIPQEEEVYQEDTNWSGSYQNEPLPSALAELGGFAQEPAASSVFVPSHAFTQQAQNPPLEEPSWLAALNTATASDSISSLAQQEMHSREEEQQRPTFQPVQPSWSEMYTPQAIAPLSSIQEEAVADPEVKSIQPTSSFTKIPARFQTKELEREESSVDSLTTTTVQPSVWSQRNRSQEGSVEQSPAASVYTGLEASVHQPETSRRDTLPNSSSELEMTMKRPAVRLQPIQQSYPFAQREPVSSPGRAYVPEQTYPGKNVESNLSYQERLLRGYQHQLVGDYDEAMQEYRMIIRSSPELLGEVVSNVRALLKIAPKYSTGYRVLGDAYMRQGEYLQAMEAYNKALTMAKRAKV